MKFSKILLTLFLLLAFSLPVSASQNSTVIPNTGTLSGLSLVNDTNAAFDTIITNFSGGTAPSSPSTWQTWLDTSNNLYKIYNGAAWLPMGSVASSQWTSISNGILANAPSSTGSSNAYVVTYSPVPTAYVTGQHYPFIANFANTTTATENVNGLGAKTIKKQGSINLISGDIANAAVVDTVYDGTNLQMVSQISNGSTGTMTSLATGNGITGGTITTSGTIGLATITANTILSNATGGAAVPIGNTLTAILDASLSSTQGSIIYRGAATWGVLTPGTAGQVLQTGGAAANPSWGSTFTNQNVVTGSRAVGSIYQNTTGKTMMVNVSVTGSTTSQFSAFTDSSATPTTLIAEAFSAGGGSGQVSLAFMVLNGNYYEITVNTGSGTLASWTEWY